METIKLDLQTDTSATNLINLNNISQNPYQDTITKKSNSGYNPNPFSHLFSHHHTHAHQKQHPNNNDLNQLIEYSSEALLQHTKEGNFSIVKEILDHYETLIHSSSDGNFPSKHLSLTAPSNSNTITGGNSAAVYSTLMPHKKVKLDLEIHDEAKQTPLIIACRNDKFDLAEILVKHGAKVNAKDADSWTPLLNAAKNGNSRIVCLLLENKALVDDRDCGGFTALMWACYKNYLDVVKVLLKYDANPNSQCKNSICCLSWAAGRGNYEIVVELLKCRNIKINLQDQNSSTPVLWAARKGSLPIITALVEKGADTELSGMHNMTPLIISCKNGHVDVAMYLSKLPNANVNHIDKDGNTALSISAKNGHTDVVLSLLEKGAYVNIPNKKGDSILITAVKGGHKEIVEALLAKHVEIDAIGNQGKTAMHYAVERGNIEIIRLILSYKPDLEIVANDADTLLLLAVKKKNATIVNELLNSGSKVSPTDKNGDNVLHIALRNKSREITELILSNPKNSKYLYKPNKEGDTPYKIDASNPKSILTQIFGARQLNMTEDSILGYDLYSGALAEILSEPSLHTPITVGLYAKWGSGKSFLLAQLKAEMKSFAKLTRVVNLRLNLFLIITVIMSSLFITIPFFFWNWLYGLVLFLSIVLCAFVFIGFCKYFFEKREKEWAERLCERISTQITRFKLLLRILFLNPFNYRNENIEHKNLRFIFTEYGKISTIGGESALALMISSLHTKMETQLGVVITRLCRVFYNKTHSHSKFRRLCCIPTFVFVILVICLILALAIFFSSKGFNIKSFKPEEEAFLFTVLFIISISIIGSSITWSKILWNLLRSPSYRIMSAVNSKDKQKNPDSKIENYIFKLKREVDLIAHTVRTIDAFTHSCTRLVIIIDGLDSCEQSKVLQILEIVHVLFTREGDPFLSILAVDPHVLIKGIEGNLIAAFRNGNVNGHDYLRTIIHLPVYLQVDLSKAKAISKMPSKLKRTSTLIGSSQDIVTKVGSDLNAAKKNKKNRKRAATKPMSAIDLTDQLIKSDYFSDVNPRNLRRLINIIALTGRLLRAYHIDFNWRILASWIYLNEQWPYRCSWLVMYYEEHEEEFDEESTLNEVYEKVKHQIPVSNEPLLELDRNARKFEQFIQNCEPKLTCTILKKILPCTCNLDPYLIKLIKESIEANQERLAHLPLNSASNLLTLNSYPTIDHLNQQNTSQLTFGYGQTFNQNRLPLPSPNLSNAPLYISTIQKESTLANNEMPSLTNASYSTGIVQRKIANKENNQPYSTDEVPSNLITLFTPQEETQNCLKIDMTKRLIEMTVVDVCDAVLNNVEYISDDFKDIYVNTIKEKNINGKVLMSCELDELKSELRMTFGDWQLFKEWLLNKRIISKKTSIVPKKIEIVKSTKPPISEPQAPKIVTSQTPSGHGRKVEFHVTPVKEVTKLRSASSPTPPEQMEPKKPILIKQNSNQVCFQRENSIKEELILNDSDKGENIPLMPKLEEGCLNQQSGEVMNASNPIGKLSKKIFKSIDNLFHKSSQQSTPSRKVSISHEEQNETILCLSEEAERKKKNSTSACEDEEEENEDEHNESGEEEDETSEFENQVNQSSENDLISKNSKQIKESKKDLTKIDSIKKSLIKVKKQLLADSSVSNKGDILGNNPSNSKTNSITNTGSLQSLPSGSGSNLSKRKVSISSPDEQKTTTYLIFEDEDEIYY